MAGTVERAYSILSTKCTAEFSPSRLSQLQSLILALRAAEQGEGGAGGDGGGGSVSAKAISAARAAEEKEPAATMLSRVDNEYIHTMRPMAYTEAELEDEQGRYAHYYRQVPPPHLTFS